MSEDIILLGAMNCPYPLFKHFDAFFLPSRFEGKPMAVTESQMLALPVLVTEYASAKEQIKSNMDGYVCENNLNGIVKMLEHYLKDRDALSEMKRKMVSINYDNDEEIKRIYELFES